MKRSVILTDRLDRDILLVLRVKGHVLLVSFERASN